MNTSTFRLQRRAACARLILTLLAVGVGSAAAQTTFIPARTVWKYQASGADAGSTWRTLGFNDAAWPSGPAQLGYGERDEATVLPAASVTTYFRRTFVVTDAAAIGSLNAWLLYDDGAVVYVNGIEAFRINMPPWTLNSLTRAWTTVADNAEFVIRLNPGLLVSGTNVVAVEVHQAQISHDLSFDFALTADTTPLPRPGVLTFTTPVTAQSEGDRSLVVNVARLYGTNGMLSVQYVITNGTATAGQDYLPETGILYFAAGETNKSITVTLLNDTVSESEETVVVLLTNVTGGATLGNAVEKVILYDDEFPVYPTGVVLSELLANNQPTNLPPGSAPGWIEFQNRSMSAADLSDLSLTDDPGAPRRYVFPANTQLPPQGFLVLNGATWAAPTNTGFALRPNGGALYLYDRPDRGGSLLDSLVYGLQAANYSLGRTHSVTGSWNICFPTRGASNDLSYLGSWSDLSINEWMAHPASGSSWFELHNTGSRPVPIGGGFLTDDPAQPAKYRIPDFSFLGDGRGAYAVWIADNHPAGGADHVNFQLAAAGGLIGWTSTVGDEIDTVTFGPQSAGVSEGRLPNGAATWAQFPGGGSPGASNEVTSSSSSPPRLVPVSSSWSNIVLRVYAASGHAIVIEASSNLTTWVSLQTNVPTDGSFLFNEPGVGGHALRIYRAWDTVAGLYSSNAWGFANRMIPPGRSLLASSFLTLSNELRAMFRYLPSGVSVFKAGSAGFVANNYLGDWTVPTMTLLPGEGCVVVNPYDSAIQVYQEGEIPAGGFRLELPAGGALFGVPNVRAGLLQTDLGFPARAGDLFQGYEDGVDAFYDYFGEGVWDPWEPVLNLGEALWFLNGSTEPRVWSEGAGTYTLALPAFLAPVPQINFFTYHPSFAYGLVWNANRSSLLTAAFQGQLYAGPAADEASLFPVGTPVRFGASGRGPGYINGGCVTLPGGAGGKTYYFQLRVWTNGLASYEAAQAYPYPSGKSAVFAGVLGAGGTLEPPGNANGFPSFELTSAPWILRAPISVTTNPGAIVTFSVQAEGTQPVAYEWRFNDQPIPGAGNPTFTLSPAREANAGNYRVVVRNAYGAVTSSVATLTIREALPVFSTAPISQGVVYWDAVVLYAGNPSVEAGVAALQWYRDGYPLWRATNTSLRWDAHAGSYYAVATNSAGAVTSQVATLTVSPRGPLDQWTWRRPLPQGNDLRAVAYGGGALVAVGTDGVRLCSTDGGVLWQPYSVPYRHNKNLAYGSGRFVSLPEPWDSLGALSYPVYNSSTNGITWSEGDAPALQDFWPLSLAFGGDRFVAVGTSARVAVWTNGWGWTVAPLNLTNRLTRVTWGNGRFVATSDTSWSGTVAISTNGFTWTEVMVRPSTLFGELTWGNGTYAICGMQSDPYGVWAVYLSSDLVSWTEHALPVQAELNSMAAGGGHWVIVGSNPDGSVFTSSDGATWTHQLLTPGNKLYSVTYALGQFIVVGEYGNIFTSTNGVSWTARSGASDLNFRGVARGNGVYVAAGNEGQLFTSPDGGAWTAPPRPTTNNIRGVAFGRGRFVAVGEPDASGALVLVSTNGAQWTRLEVPGTLGLYDIMYAQDRFVAVGDARVLVSPDGLDWGSFSSSTSQRLNSVTWGGGFFVAVGRNTTMVSSPDGTNWSSRLTYSSGKYLQGVAYGNGRFVAAGRNGFVLTTTNFYNWQTPPTPLNDDVEDLLFAEGQFVLVGQNGLCATSPDGAIWTRHWTKCGNDLRALIFENGCYTLVGNNETILQSGTTGAPPPFVRRELTPSLVRLIASPEGWVNAYAVEERVPAGVVVGNVSDGGWFDPVLHKVKFGPFTDSQPRVLTYTIDSMPNCAYDLCRHTFTGVGSADGIDTPIVGDTEQLTIGLHPADLSPPLGTLTIGEVTAYAGAWRRSLPWPQSPNPIPIDYVTRAAALWRSSECYQPNALVTNAPLCWVPCYSNTAPAWVASLGSVSSVAERRLPPAYLPGDPVTVRIETAPPATALAYAVEDTPPFGWTVSEISDDGEWNAASGTVRWGPFFDHAARRLTYRLVPPPGTTGEVHFTGTASFDGEPVRVAGRAALVEGCRLTLAREDAAGALRVHLQGAAGSEFAVWVSPDLLTWELLSLSVTNRQVLVYPPDHLAASPQLFFRVQPAP